MNADPKPRGGPAADTKFPGFALPPGACDCHVHIYGPAARFPFAPAQRARAFNAPRDALLNGGGRYRAVALVDDDISDARLEELHHFRTRCGDTDKVAGGKPGRALWVRLSRGVV